MKWCFEDELPCDITTRLFDRSKIVDGVRMYPCCARCGDLLKHDDDGERVCRHCNQSVANDGETNAITPA